MKAVSDAAPRDARLENVWQAFLGAFDEIVAARIVLDQSAGIAPEFDPLPVTRALERMDAALLAHACGTQEKADKSGVLSAIRRVWFSTLYPCDAEVMLLNKDKPYKNNKTTSWLRDCARRHPSKTPKST